MAAIAGLLLSGIGLLTDSLTRDVRAAQSLRLATRARYHQKELGKIDRSNSSSLSPQAVDRHHYFLPQA